MENTKLSETTQEEIKQIDSRATSVNLFGKVMHYAGIYAVALMFLLSGIILQSLGIINNFLTVQNMLNILDAVSMLGRVAVGMAFVTYSGQYADLSAPTTMALTGIVAVQMLQFGFIPAIIAAV